MLQDRLSVDGMAQRPDDDDDAGTGDVKELVGWVGVCSIRI